MGCSSSTPVHPSIYNETLKRREGGPVRERRTPREERPNHLMGDYTQYQLAKHTREQNHKQRQIKIFMAADEMSGKMLEEREMLSLGTRSRGTSRNTSRAASPTATKRAGQTKDPNGTPMTPVVEDKFSRDSYRRQNGEAMHDEYENIKATNDHSNSTHSPKKKHKTNKSGKTRKSKKHSKGKKSKKSKNSKIANSEGIDSGLDDDPDDDDDDNKENELIDIVAGANSDVELSNDVIDDVTNENAEHSESAVNGDNSELTERTMYSSSKDSGIHVVEVVPSAELTDIHEDIRSDSRL